MKKITILILLFAQIQAQGQITLERRTINAQSGTAPVSNFFVSWSIGEPIVGTVQAGNYTLTQGFQQPEKRISRPTVAAQNNTLFTAQGRGVLNRIQLDWVENTATKGDIFLVQKNQNGQFETIATVEAADGVDNRYYVAYDEKPNTDEANIYRIILSRSNGSRRESTEISVNMLKLLDFSIHPNPATNDVLIDLKAFEGRPVEILMSDLAGKVIRREKVEKATAVPHHLDVSSMESGAYFLTIQTSGKRAVVRKLSIMK